MVVIVVISVWMAVGVVSAVSPTTPVVWIAPAAPIVRVSPAVIAVRIAPTVPVIESEHRFHYSQTIDDHYVVGAHIVNYGVEKSAVVTVIVIARRHNVNGGGERIEVAFIVAFVIGEDYLLVGIVTVFVEDQYLLQRTVGFGLCDHGLYLRFARFGLGLFYLGLALLRLGYGKPVVSAVHIVVISIRLRCVPT